LTEELSPTKAFLTVFGSGSSDCPLAVLKSKSAAGFFNPLGFGILESMARQILLVSHCNTAEFTDKLKVFNPSRSFDIFV
jgi:hypothetical protein